MEISRSNVGGGSNDGPLFDSFRTELLSPAAQAVVDQIQSSSSASWRLNVSEFHLPEQRRSSDHHSFSVRRLLPTPRKQGKIAEYYKRQERLVEGFNEMDTINESGCLPASLTEEEMKQLAKSERMAIHLSNMANVILFIAKIYASVQSKSLAVIASTLDSLLDLLSGFILWFTSHAMKNPNQYHYPIGKKRMQPVGIIVFASVMATLGLQILFESAKELINQSRPEMDHEKEKWTIGIMVSVTVVKFLLMVYCRRFKNEIVRAYAQDHFFDVITNSVGLVTAVLAVRFYWWIDPTGAIIVSSLFTITSHNFRLVVRHCFTLLIIIKVFIYTLYFQIAVYTISTWARTVAENVGSLIGRTAPPDFLTKLTYLIWNHHEEIKHIDTVRAYTFGVNYFVEVDIVLPEDMFLNQAHNIGETLQEKLEQLPEVERAFVHIDFEFTHRPEHKITV
uniref:Cation diffusion facilitator 9 n=1 Tax=Solanum tuberosum TaxID=4113 RepID=M1ASG8_SOLTU